MTLTDYLEKWGRTLFESPLSRAVPMETPQELAEIRFAVLEEVKSKCYRAGGRLVFPFDLVSVTLRGVEEARAVVFRSGFFRSFVEHEVTAHLRAEAVRFPERLRVEVEVSTGLPLPDEKWLTVAVGAQDAAAGSRIPARLLVRKGSANVTDLPIDKPRVYIGRGTDVYREGGLRRRNDLAFADEGEMSQSVSREHAHIDFDRTTGEHRLFNDRWYERGADCGTRIVRNGVSVEVHRDPRGTKLEPRDEVHLGQAILSFEL